MWIIAKRRPPLEHWFPVALVHHYTTAKTIAWNLAKYDSESLYLLTPCFDSYEAWDTEMTRIPMNEQFVGELQFLPSANPNANPNSCRRCHRDHMPHMMKEGICPGCRAALAGLD